MLEISKPDYRIVDLLCSELELVRIELSKTMEYAICYV